MDMRHRGIEEKRDNHYKDYCSHNPSVFQASEHCTTDCVGIHAKASNSLPPTATLITDSGGHPSMCECVEREFVFVL